MFTLSRAVAFVAIAVVLACAPATERDDASGDSTPPAITAGSDTTFRAHGQEPGWVVAVFGTDSISFLLDYGDWRFSIPAETPVSMGDTTTWHMRYDTLDINLRAFRTLCTDAMRGDSFPAHATLTLGTRTLDGCGRWPMEAAP